MNTNEMNQTKLLFLLVAAIAFASCRPSARQTVADAAQPTDSTEAVIIADTLRMVISDKYLMQNDSIVQAMLINPTGRSYIYEADFFIEQEVNGQWYEVPFPNGLGFVSLAKSVPAHDSSNVDGHIGMFHLKQGHYRMSKKIEGHTLSDDFYVGKQRNYTEQELNDIMDTISRRLGKCDALASCISGYGILEKGIEVNFIYNTPERRRLFRQQICDAPILRFTGPESPIRMSKIGVNDTLGISLRPTKPIFPLTAETVTFILKNNSDSELTCGEECDIAFLDEHNTWRKAPRNESFNAIGYEIPPRGQRTVIGRLCPKAFPTPATRFRFFYPVRFNGKSITLMTEFETR